jgi:hypothetical protein
MESNPPGPLVAPGKYTVKLTVDGQSFTQSVEVLRDPKITTSDEDIQRSVKLQLRIRDDVTKTADMINNLEWSRKQLGDLERMYAESKNQEMVKSIQDMDRRMQGVEYKLVSKALTTSDDKYYVEAWKAYYNLLWLNGEIGPGAGDVAGGNDFAPTDTSIALLNQVEEELTGVQAEYKALLEQQLPAFNRALLEHGAVPLGITAPAKATSTTPGGSD